MDATYEASPLETAQAKRDARHLRAPQLSKGPMSESRCHRLNNTLH